MNAEVINPRLGIKSSDELRPGVCDINGAVLMSQRARIKGAKFFDYIFMLMLTKEVRLKGS